MFDEPGDAGAQRALDMLTRRMTAAYGALPEAVVAATVAGCAARWRDAKVVDFVPLLVERDCRRELRRLLRDAPDGDGPDGDEANPNSNGSAAAGGFPARAPGGDPPAFGRSAPGKQPGRRPDFGVGVAIRRAQ